MPTLACWFIRASLGYLTLGFTAGALILAAKGAAVGAGAWRLLPAHTELLLVGWTVQLAMGVAFWILPRFEGGRSRGTEALAWSAFVLLNAGVLAAAVGPVLGGPPSVLFWARVAEGAAAVAFAAHAWRRVRRASV